MLKITDEESKLLTLFIGEQYIEKKPKRDDYGSITFWTRRPGLDAKELKTTHLRSINEKDFEDIEEVFTGILRSRPVAERLLWILWVREDKFGLDTLKADVKSSFAQNALGVDLETVASVFENLLQKKYLQDMIVNYRESGVTSENGSTKVYSLTPEGKETAERMFKKMNDGSFAYIEPSSIVLKTKNTTNSKPTHQTTRMPKKDKCQEARDKYDQMSNQDKIALKLRAAFEKCSAWHLKRAARALLI